MYDYNFGGLKGVGPGGQSTLRWTREGWGAAERRAPHRFRAYADPRDGALDYVALLLQRYRPALAAAERGDVPGFVAELKRGGYFSGDEAVYSQRLARFAALALGGGFDQPMPSNRMVDR